MNRLTKVKKRMAWFMLAVMVLSALSGFSACMQGQAPQSQAPQSQAKQSQAPHEDKHAGISRFPETPLVYPGESFVSPTPELTGIDALNNNGYDRYYGQMQKLLRGEKLEDLSLNEHDAISSLTRENGEVFIKKHEYNVYEDREWCETIFKFPNPDIWYDIFPPGTKLADSLEISIGNHYFLGDPNEEIVIPGYDQSVDAQWSVIFGGDWMVVYLSWGEDFEQGGYDRFTEEMEYELAPDDGYGRYLEENGWLGWEDSPFGQYAHTWILRTTDNWQTWEHWDSRGADAIGGHFVAGAHISPNGIGYICYGIYTDRFNDGSTYIDNEGIRKLMVTNDGGKTWERLVKDNAAKYGWHDGATSFMSPSYFEGEHGIVKIVPLGWTYDDEKNYAESFDGGKTWECIKVVYDEAAGSWRIERATPNGDE